VNSRRSEPHTKNNIVRSPNELSTLDDFLAQEGKRVEFEAVAIKEVLAWQIAEAMKAQNLSRKRLAERMGTSRSQISRLLDPKDGNVTIATLQRAAKMVGRSLRLELI
jgi:predicted XRE-type DNA-binding protein